MCQLCEKTNKNSPGYNYYPYCGSSFNPTTFIPNVYSIELSSSESLGRTLGGLTTVKTNMNRYERGGK